MKYPEILVPGATGKIGHAAADQRFGTATTKARATRSSDAWFAGGDRIGYDPEARAMFKRNALPSTCS
jgi:hypothetical protein